MKLRVWMTLAVVGVCSLGYSAPPQPAEGAFEIRGLKGLYWDGMEKYEKALPWMADHGMNWLMFCYTSFPESARDWRKDYSAKQLADFKDFTARAQDKGVTVCLSFNPGIWSNPPLSHSSEADYQTAWRKVRDCHAVGIQWFALCLDDIKKQLTPEDKAKYGDLQTAQMEFTNRLWKDMQTLKPVPKLIFCPSAYTTEHMKEHAEYTAYVGKHLDPSIDIFWTGPTVCSASISVADAQEAEKLFGRKPFVWDNYPVNDMFPKLWRPLLAPLKNRDPKLPGAVSGILFNPMKQWEVNKIPLESVAAYLNDPVGYKDSNEYSLADFPDKDREAGKLLVKLYGHSFLGEKDYPPTPDISTPERAAQAIKDLEDLKRLLTQECKDCDRMKAIWEEIRVTAEKDLENARAKAGEPRP